MDEFSVLSTRFREQKFSVMLKVGSNYTSNVCSNARFKCTVGMVWDSISSYLARGKQVNIKRLDAGDHATNNKTAWLVIVGSLDQEMLVPDVTLSVIKPN